MCSLWGWGCAFGRPPLLRLPLLLQRRAALPAVPRRRLCCRLPCCRLLRLLLRLGCRVLLRLLLRSELRAILLQGRLQEAVHDDVRVPPDGGGEVGVAGHRQGVVPPLRLVHIPCAEVLRQLRAQQALY